MRTRTQSPTATAIGNINDRNAPQISYLRGFFIALPPRKITDPFLPHIFP